MDWLTHDEVLREWPDLGTIGSSRVAGSGLLLETSSGRAHLKPRPRARIRGEMWVLGELAARGVPVTVPLLTRTGHTHLNTVDRSWFVYRELGGTALARPLDQPGEAELLGAVSAELGRHLAALDITTAIAEGVPVRTPTAVGSGLPLQLVHRDFHAGNVVFTDGEVTGFLDFDHLEIGPRIVDLAYLAGSVLAELSTRGDTDLWPERWRRLVAGHLTVTALSDDEIRALAPMLVEVERDFATWFHQIGDTDNAALTEHMIGLVESQVHHLTIAALEQAAASGRLVDPH